jgi:hypothetical protein
MPVMEKQITTQKTPHRSVGQSRPAIGAGVRVYRRSRETVALQLWDQHGYSHADLTHEEAWQLSQALQAIMGGWVPESLR